MRATARLLIPVASTLRMAIPIDSCSFALSPMHTPSLRQGRCERHVWLFVRVLSFSRSIVTVAGALCPMRSW